jgi:hypothetical protein
MEIPWIRKDPLPVVGAQINGLPVNLVLDTAAGDLVLDERFASTAGVRFGAPDVSHFAGGLAAPVRYGHAGELRLGRLEIEDLPVQIMALEDTFAPFFVDIPIHGVLGTAVMSRFTTTLDYRNGRLRLVAPSAGPPPCGPVPEREGSAFWIAEHHFLIVGGTMAGVDRPLLVLDSAMAGTDFAVPEAVARAAAMETRSERHTDVGMGGGGAVTGRRGWIRWLGLDRVSRSGPQGLSMQAFPLEARFGFPVHGLLGHGFFRDCVLSLDFPRMRLELAAAAR